MKYKIVGRDSSWDVIYEEDIDFLIPIGTMIVHESDDIYEGIVVDHVYTTSDKTLTIFVQYESMARH